MTPKQRFEAVFRGEPVDKVPFTCYSFLMYACQAERELRNQGLCYIVYRGIPCYKTTYNKTTDEIRIFTGEDGIRRQTITYHTPVGDISETGKLTTSHNRIALEHLPFHESHLFKGPDDYKPIIAMIEDRDYSDNYEAFINAQDELGEDGIVLPNLGTSPMQEILLQIMGIEKFGQEWAYRRNKLMELHEVLLEDRRKIYPFMVNSPTDILLYCGNVSPSIVGPERFEKYFIPHYNELADLAHEKGKLLAVHFDDSTRMFADAIAKSRIDIIEAFDPNNDMTVADARKAWPDKFLSLNFPSAAHLESPSEVERITRQILEEAKPLKTFVMGVTENAPHNKWQQSFLAISRVLDKEGRFF